jgi:hypothetical protein
MPIRINLLAEAQELEEMRRRDPVKRAILAAVLIGAALLGYSVLLQLRATVAHHDLSRLDDQISSHSNEFRLVVEGKKKLDEVDDKLLRLKQLTADRMLNGTLLNALQQTTVEDVQLTRLNTQHAYVFAEGTKSRTNEDHVIAGKPSTVTEKVVLTLEAKDTGADPGSQVNKFKAALSDSSYFQPLLNRTNELRMTKYEAQQVPVTFALEIRFPDKIR